jgi:hypothetical protein
MLQTKKNMDDKSELRCFDDDEMNEGDFTEGLNSIQHR